MLISLLFLFLFGPPSATVLPHRPGTGADPLDVDPRERHPKIQSSLFHLTKILRMSGMEKAQEFARRNAIEMDESGVRIVIETAPFGRSSNRLIAQNRVQSLSSLLSAAGAKIEATHDWLIQARMPIDALSELQENMWIQKIRLPLTPHPCVVSEGVDRVGALEWTETAPYKPDAEVKVCILDIGFSGYLELLGEELPSSVVAKSFRADGDLFTDKHGTACAEILFDIAPNVEFYLVNIGTDVEFFEAIEWIADEEVDVISCSLGWVNAGAGDGTGPINAAVEWAHWNGIIWVNSAGNDADAHWMGTFNDPDSNGWHNFSSDDELFSFYLPAGEWFGIFLNWDSWGTWDGYSYSGSGEDFDLFFYHWNGSFWDLAGFSSNEQSGDQWPIEEICGETWPSGRYAIAIKKMNSERDVEFDLRIWEATSLEYVVPEESIDIPADSPYALAVGATGWSSDAYHYYSSRGPTKDGRIKPDLTSPSGVSTVSYGPFTFYGTSSSAPLVAGACALLKEKTPLSQEQIMETLEGRALDLGEPGKDNFYGSGRLKLNK